jgi:starch synthase
METALEEILRGLGDQGVYILLGTGNRTHERFLLDLSYRFSNFAFLKGYSDACATALYRNGDLFLMPSSFEPCGIGQMLAMREGQPCVVHEIGGLKDTVRNGVNGFSFAGYTPADQADNFVKTVHQAVQLLLTNPDQFERIRRAAFAARFLWSDSVRLYRELLYHRRA